MPTYAEAYKFAAYDGLQRLAATSISEALPRSLQAPLRRLPSAGSAPGPPLFTTWTTPHLHECAEDFLRDSRVADVVVRPGSPTNPEEHPTGEHQQRSDQAERLGVHPAISHEPTLGRQIHFVYCARRRVSRLWAASSTDADRHVQDPPAVTAHNSDMRCGRALSVFASRRQFS